MESFDEIIGDEEEGLFLDNDNGGEGEFRGEDQDEEELQELEF